MFAWIFFNLVVPFGLPFVPLLILQAVRKTISEHNADVAKNIRLTLAIKDGQLCITCIAVIALTFYELWAVRSTFSAIILICLGIMATICTILIAYSTLYPTPADGIKNENSWRKRYEVAFVSLICSAIVIVLAVVGHQLVTDHEGSLQKQSPQPPVNRNL